MSLGAEIGGGERFHSSPSASSRYLQTKNSKFWFLIELAVHVLSEGPGSNSGLEANSQEPKSPTPSQRLLWLLLHPTNSVPQQTESSSPLEH